MILASDFDNTLFVDDLNQLEMNIQKIKEWQQNNKFVITTGRSLFSIMPLIKKYNIPYDYLICENGAMIFDSNHNLIESTYLEKKDILEILKIISEYHLNYILDTGYEYTDTIENKNLACIFIQKKDQKSIEQIVNCLNKKTNTYHYLSKYHINIINANVRKDKSLEKLRKLLEINKIFCIGDAVNDIPMIIKYHGGIMKKHEQELDNLPNKNYASLSDYIEELI